MKYALLLSYDGTNYAGWQIQNNAQTVQACVEQAVWEAFQKRATVTASGRTDAGVHAAGQVCHFSLDVNVPGERMADALNAHLPEDIRVILSVEAPQEFDSNRSAKRKTYCYRFYLSSRNNPLKNRYSARVKGKIDFDKLQEAADLLKGEHDFKAYCASGSTAKTTVRTIYDIAIQRKTEHFSQDVAVYVTGNGFLYNMVRTIVGTMIWYAQGRISKEDIILSLSQGERERVGKTMPPHGLTLEEVDYGFQLF